MFLLIFCLNVATFLFSVVPFFVVVFFKIDWLLFCLSEPLGKIILINVNIFYISVFFLLLKRCGFKTEGQSGGKESATGKSSKPKVTLQPPTIYPCYRGQTATHRQVLRILFYFIHFKHSWTLFSASKENEFLCQLHGLEAVLCFIKNMNSTLTPF